MIDSQLHDRELYLGLDLGTSGLKAVAVAPCGDLVAFTSTGYQTSRPVPGAAEQDPGCWTAAVRDALAGLAKDAPPVSWRAIGLTGMLPTLVTADASGKPVGPAITWEDSRAETQAHLLRTRFGRNGERDGGEALYRITGQWVDGRYLLPMFARIAADEPDRAAGTATILGAKDFLFGWLTGHLATDPSTATGFGCYDLSSSNWAGEVLTAAADTMAAVLPSLPPVWPSGSTRPLREDLAAEFGCGKIPVCLGAADSVVGADALGACSAGQVAYVAGTSTVVLGITDRLVLDPWNRFLVTPLVSDGMWGMEMDLLATGSSLRWLAGLLGGGLDEAGVLALAAQLDPADAPVFLPYLSPGEQGALWDPGLTGSVTGLTLRHDRRHLARALVNGIVLESRRCVHVLDEIGPLRGELLVAGGSAAAASFRADLADATGRPVVAPPGQDAAFSAFGAARLAAGGSWPASGEALSVTEPDLRKTAVWDALWDAHERARLSEVRLGLPRGVAELEQLGDRLEVPRRPGRWRLVLPLRK